MRHTIDTAPRNGEFVIIVDDASNRFDIAQWLVSREWVREDGKPSQITPSHWSPIAIGENRPFSLNAVKAPQQDEPIPVPSRDEAPHEPSTDDFVPAHIASAPAIVPHVESQTAAVPRPRRFVTSIAVALVAALLIGLSFHAELESLLARYPSLQTTFEKQIQQASQEAHQPQVEPNPAGVPLNARSGAPVPEAQPLSVSSERHNALANELAEARRSLDAINLQLRLEAAKAQSFEQQLQREQERTAALTSELAEVRRDFDTRMTSSSKASEEAVQSARMQEAMTAALQRSFEEERSRSAALASELATARRDLGTRAASSSNAVDELAQLRKTTEGTTAELRQSLQQEREKVSALASELATARRDLETRAAASSNAVEELAQLRKTTEGTTAELRQSLQQEREKVAALASELATARRDLETRAAASSNAVEELAQLRKTTEATTAELRQSLQQEREKVAALAPDLESTKRMSGALQSPGPTSSGENGQTKPVAAERPVTPAVQGDPEAVGLMARAKVLLAQGNIGAARIVLERAVEMGSAEASFALAETYDPRILSSWGTYGTRGDTSKARELYAKALAGGIQRAKDRFDALRQ